MTPQRWRQVSDLLHTVRAMPVDERSSFLASVCGDDTGLRREVDSLLALEGHGTWLDEPVFSIHDEDPDIGLRIGPYQTLELLGRGGMGAVYLAARQNDFDQQVALKLIKRGMDSDEILRRFHNERQILANLDHANIARLLDGGTTADGRPYFVMEYIDGEPIDRYCERRHLSLRERLDLFLQVCAAVHLSHQNLVVHRDLKPGNILISRHDGVPKLLDFGIAKLLEPGLTGHPLQTVPGRQPLTFKYASPEQVRGERITTASDTYSLGVLLYRLLTGHYPLALDDLPPSSSDAMGYRICEVEPIRPSQVVDRTPPSPLPQNDFEDDTEAPQPLRPQRSARRSRATLKRRLAGDLDAIVLKALRKEPTRRYGSVLELSNDIRRHLSGLPVAARRGTLPYLVGKFLRRNRLALAVMLTIVAFAASSTVLWLRAETERHRAELERARTQRAVQFLVDLFESSDPDQAKGAPLTALDALERGRVRYAHAVAEDPELQETLADVLSRVYLNLGLYGEAHDVMGSALDELRRRHPGDSHEMAKRLNNVGAFSFNLGDYGAAEAYFREALEMRQRLGQGDAMTIRNMNNLASTLALRGAFTEAETLYRKGLDIRQHLDGPNHSRVATSLRHVAHVRHLQGDTDEAEQLLVRALEIRRRLFDSEDTRVASILTKLAAVLATQNRLDEAQALYGQALAIQEARYGMDHLKVAATQKELAQLLLSRDDLADSELERARGLLQQALRTFSRHRPADDPDIADAISLFGSYLLRRGAFADAASCLARGHAMLESQRAMHVLYIQAAAERLDHLRAVRPSAPGSNLARPAHQVPTARPYAQGSPGLDGTTEGNPWMTAVCDGSMVSTWSR